MGNDNHNHVIRVRHGCATSDKSGRLSLPRNSLGYSCGGMYIVLCFLLTQKTHSNINQSPFALLASTAHIKNVHRVQLRTNKR